MAGRWNLIALTLLVALVAIFTASEYRTAPLPLAAPSPSQASKAVDPSLPNLVVTDLLYDPPYIKIVYKNIGGPRVGADFLISLSSKESSFKGNHNYRFPVPAPGQTVVSGGFTPGLIGLKQPFDDIQPGPHGLEGYYDEILVLIDPEDRVRESDEEDNASFWVVHLSDDISETQIQQVEVPLADRSRPAAENGPDRDPDLIVTDAKLAGGQLIFTIANQGALGSPTRFDATVSHKGEEIGRLTALSVPDPGESATVKISSPNLGPSALIQIDLDPGNTVVEGRENNNSFLRQLDQTIDGGLVR